tara:strand:+ start:1403 stop:2065 length:663 start_codon:yes stop_codon:yes gene_type:complete
MEKSKSSFTKIRSYFLTGIIVTAPVGLTFYVAILFIGFIDSKVKSIIPSKYHYDNLLPFDIPGIGLVIVFLLLTFIGFLTAGLIGRYIIKLGERIISRLPIIRSIYGALKQIFENVLNSSSKSFREVVLIEYPRKGIWAIGFITGNTKGEVKSLSNKEMVNVFLPTTPNPTSGFLLFLPKKDVKILNMSIEEGIKMVISGGIVTPNFKSNTKSFVKKRKH